MAMSCGHRVTEPERKRERVEAGDCPACVVPMVDQSPSRRVWWCLCCATYWHLTEDGQVFVYEWT